MFVNCPGCNTHYVIDERKVPPRGAKMTCRECGNSWKVGGSPPAHAATRPAPTSSAPASETASQKAAATPPHSEISATLLKPVHCPSCGHLFVPYAPAPPGAPAQATPSSSKPAAARGKVLLVEDQNYFAELTREALSKAYDTTVAATLGEAGKLLDSGPYDLVILDLSLEEGEDGTQLLRATKKRGIPVLIFTARDETELYGSAWEQLKSAGASDILIKGVHVGEELRQKVQSMLGASRK